MDINALKRAKEKIDSKTGSEGFLNQKSITAETVVRLLPPSPLLEGMFHMEVIKWWIGGKSIICASTFGKKSVIEEELLAAKQSEDEDIQALANNTDSKTGVSKKVEFWMALLQLEYQLNKKEEIVGVNVVDDQAKILQCGSTLLSSMIKVATSRKAITAAQGSEDGIADRENGSNIILSKQGTKLNTKYDAALDESMEMPAKYYIDIPDAYNICKDQMKTASYQRAFIRQYLYGEPIPAEVEQKEKDRVEALKASRQSAAAAPVAKKKKAAPVAEEEDEDETPAPKKKAAAPAPTTKKKKDILLDDDDDEDAPPAKPAAKKKAAAIVEDEDEDEDLPPVKKKKLGKPAIADDDDEDEEPPVKPAKKKAAIVDDDDEDEEPVPKKKAKPAIADDDDDDDAPPVSKKAVAPKKTATKKTIIDEIDDLDDDDE